MYRYELRSDLVDPRSLALWKVKRDGSSEKLLFLERRGAIDSHPLYNNPVSLHGQHKILADLIVDLSSHYDAAIHIAY